MSTAIHKPTFTDDETHSLLAVHYGVHAKALRRLPGERDQNFAVTTDQNHRFVFKISGVTEETDFLAAQNEALRRLSNHCDFVPRVVPTINGHQLVDVSKTDQRFRLRLVSYLPGKPLATIGVHSSSLLSDFGRKLGQIDIALSDFDHPAIHREFDWNLQNGLFVVDRHVGEIKDSETQRHVRAIQHQLEERLPELLPKLRCSAIHNDANDYNVLVSTSRDSYGERHVSGIIDFGDMAWSYTVADLAVAIAYLIFRKENSLEDACHVVSAYHKTKPLTDIELATLYDVMRLRVCVSACLAAHQQQLRPNDEYLSISQAPICKTLPWLARMHPRWAEGVFRDACGLISHPRAASVARWLDQAQIHPVMDVPLTSDNTELLDLSVGSPLTAECVRDPEHDTIHDRLSDLTDRLQKPFALGRYNEPRTFYKSTLFNGGERSTDPSRTIHLGLDVFAAAGTKIYAPLPGRVACIQFNAAPLDYGTLVVLEHAFDQGEHAKHRFYSLYGHLGRASTCELHVGQNINAGDLIGTLGLRDENGGWAPHLHVQLIADDLEQPGTERSVGDVPGVAFPRQRRVWTSISPNPAALLQLDDALLAKSAPHEKHVEARRKALTGTNLSIAYRRPLHIVQGWMQYLFDDTGRRYLDAYNNVPHVGHCHPRVVAAANAQMETLNTNTRYLSDLFNEYTERLSATLPDGLEVCYLVNSASEANELALRLARATTGRHAIVVQQAAYHGHTTSLIDISPYKHNGAGGAGAPDWVHTIPLPDGYRGRFRGNDERCGRQFADHAEQQVQAAAAGSQPPAAFIAETCPSVAGQIMPPPNYLSRVYQSVRAAGALCIADEVQTGLGRLGTHFWGFERFDVVPDIVVMGKPMGNGHPLAAVVTTRHIAESFANGMEFFSTFGGNTVSCAVGLAVLDVIRDERLQERAMATGELLREGFGALQQRFSLIGDVRGSGLFWGLELVRSRLTLEPADAEATLITNRMRDRGILIGTDGPHRNVLKIRPPMSFVPADASLLLETLTTILNEEFSD